MNCGVCYKSVVPLNVFQWKAVCHQERYKSFSDLERWVIINLDNHPSK